MTEYLKFWGGRSRTFLAVSNFLSVRYVCVKYLPQSIWHPCERISWTLFIFPFYRTLSSNILEYFLFAAANFALIICHPRVSNVFLTGKFYGKWDFF